MSVEIVYQRLRDYIHSEVPDAAADHGLTFDFNASHRQRYHCSIHGTVVPFLDRYDCPYCLPYDPIFDGPSFTVTVAGMVSLNPS